VPGKESGVKMVGMAETGAPISLDRVAVHLDCWCVCLCYLHTDGKMYLLVPAHPGCLGQSPESCNGCVFVCVCVCAHACACVQYGNWINATSTNKCLHHFVHATLYTTTFLVYPLLTTSTDLPQGSKTML